jgi:CRISPR/Cas system-associated exonuclease Cas4 (RecB family)
LDLHENSGKQKRWEMQKGIIEFLEPNPSTSSGQADKYKREEFEISDKEVKELKKIIQKVAEEITTFSFWGKTCGNKDCEYCGYRKLLRFQNQINH